MGSGYICRGACDRFKVRIDCKNAYIGNGWCSRCSCWILEKDFFNKNRCVCCHVKIRQKKRYTREKEVKRIT